MEIFFLPLLAVIMLALPVAAVIKKYKTGKQAKTALLVNLGSFFAVLALAMIFPIGGLVSAEATTAVATAASGSGLGYIAAVAAAAPAAIGAVAEEPKTFSKALIFVALGEGVALYGFLISFMILNKLG